MKNDNHLGLLWNSFCFITAQRKWEQKIRPNVHQKYNTRGNTSQGYSSIFVCPSSTVIYPSPLVASRAEFYSGRILAFIASKWAGIKYIDFSPPAHTMETNCTKTWPWISGQVSECAIKRFPFSRILLDNLGLLFNGQSQIKVEMETKI